MVAPPSEFTLPYLAMPTTRKRSVVPRAATPTGLPTSRSSSSAVPLSTTTCPSPVAQWPATRFRGLNRVASGSNPKPNLGAFSLPISLPSDPIRRIWSAVPVPEIAPAAAATPGTSRTLATSFSSIVDAPLEEPDTSSLPVITALVFAAPEVKISSNAFEIVSVRTKVPQTIATPSTTASAVSVARPRRSQTPLSATRLMPPAAPPSSG